MGGELRSTVGPRVGRRQNVSVPTDGSPTMRQFQQVRHLLGLAALLAGCSAPQRYEFETVSMGTTFRVVLYADDATQAELAASAAFARIGELNDALSDYDPGSELSLLSASTSGRAGVTAEVSVDLARVLARAAEVSAATGGAFDVTVGPYVRLWRRAVRQEELPDTTRLHAAARSVGWQHVTLAGRGVHLAAADMRLDLGGIAKGDALDQALSVLAQHGVKRALVDGGGDVAVGDPPPGERGWRITLGVGGEPRDLLLLANHACATSGDAFRFVELDGVRYSHVVDPRTGLGVTSGQAATVLARRGIDADAWASALCVLTIEDGLARIEATEGLEARVWQKPQAQPCDSGGFAERMVR